MSNPVPLWFQDHLEKVKKTESTSSPTPPKQQQPKSLKRNILRTFRVVSHNETTDWVTKVLKGMKNKKETEESSEQERAVVDLKFKHKSNKMMRNDIVKFMNKVLNKKDDSVVSKMVMGSSMITISQNYLKDTSEDAFSQVDQMVNIQNTINSQSIQSANANESEEKIRRKYIPHLFATKDFRDRSREEKPKRKIYTTIDYNLLAKSRDGVVQSDLINAMKKKKKMGIFARVSKFINDKGLKKNDINKTLKKYSKVLSSVIKSGNHRIKELQKQERNTKKDIIKNIKNLKKKYLIKLIKFYRQFIIVRLLKIKNQILLEYECKKIIETRLKYVNSAIKSEIVPLYICDQFFEEVDDILLKEPRCSEKWLIIKNLDKIENDFRKKYEFQRKVSKMKSKKELGEFLIEIIIPKAFDFYKQKDFSFVWQDDIEGKFNSIVGDSRTSVGKSILCFIDEINQHGMENIPSSEYIAYMDSVVKCLSEAFDISDKFHLLLISQMTHRYIFSLIGENLLNIERKLKKKEDDIYNDKMQLLRHLSPIQIGVPRSFMNVNNLNSCFQKAIGFLEYLIFGTDPNVILHSIRCMASSIGEEAKTNCLKNGCSWEFGADDFFPILVYVIVQTGIPDICSTLSYISKFATTHKKPGKINAEIKYFKTCFEGAVMYVSEMTLDQLRSLLEEKNENLKLKDYGLSHIKDTDYVDMENSLEAAIDICGTLIDECKITSEGTFRNSSFDVDIIKIENERDEELLKNRNQDEDDIDVNLLDTEFVYESDDDNFDEMYIEELMHSHLGTTQVNYLTKFLSL